MRRRFSYAVVVRTALTEALGLRHPIVQAPMGGVAGPELADAIVERLSRQADALLGRFV